MKTFLEYVTRSTLGSPPWNCPWCDSARAFRLLPHRPPYKDRYRCHRCGQWGDEADLLRFCHDTESYPQRQKRLRKLREDFDRDRPADSFSPVATWKVQHTSGCLASMYDEFFDPREEAFSKPAEQAVGRLVDWLLEHFEVGMHELPAAMEVATMALRLCVEHGMHPASFAERCGHMAWSSQLDIDHVLPECDEDDCGHFACMVNRGVPMDKIREKLAQLNARNIERAH